MVAVDALAAFMEEVDWPDKSILDWMLRGISVADDFSDVGILLAPDHNGFLENRCALDSQLLSDKNAGWLESWSDPRNPAWGVPRVPMIAPPRGVAFKLKPDLSLKARITTDHSFPRPSTRYSGSVPLPLSLNDRLRVELLHPDYPQLYLVQATEILVALSIMVRAGLNPVCMKFDLTAYFRTLAASLFLSGLSVVKDQSGFLRDWMAEFGASNTPSMACSLSDLYAGVVWSRFQKRVLVLFQNGQLSAVVHAFIVARAPMGQRQSVPGVSGFYVDDLIISTDASLKSVLEECALEVLKEANLHTAADKSSLGTSY